MISKNTFVKTINNLRDLDKKMSAVDDAMKNLNADFCGFYVTEPFDMVVELLTECLNDTEEWLSYFIYERDWLENYHLGDITVHGVPVKIESWEDVYDFIKVQSDINWCKGVYNSWKESKN